MRRAPSGANGRFRAAKSCEIEAAEATTAAIELTAGRSKRAYRIEIGSKADAMRDSMHGARLYASVHATSCAQDDDIVVMRRPSTVAHYCGARRLLDLHLRSDSLRA